MNIETHTRVLLKALGLSASLAMLPPSLHAQPGSLPRDLAAVADSARCGPVSNFYARSGMVEPPFVYGVAAGEKGESAAFWCFQSDSAEYRLVVVRRSQPRVELAWRNYPGGLSIVVDLQLDLSDFIRVDDQTQSGPPQLITASRVLKSSKEGSYVLFVEWNQVWYFRLFH